MNKNCIDCKYWDEDIACKECQLCTRHRKEKGYKINPDHHYDRFVKKDSKLDFEFK